MESIRSNISKDQHGTAMRKAVFDEFEYYCSWKQENNQIDIQDQILNLLHYIPDEAALFDAAYLDEVQDFSYAAIFLICKVAGRSNSSWIMAGDTAQMISVGCSFKFDGLKQTLLAAQPGIENRLKKVCHLLVNYRTTADVLRVGNVILDLAKKYFPDAIEYAQPEVATKDNKFDVVLIDWDKAFEIKNLSFGENQAVICSADENRTDYIVECCNEWLPKHPFILSPVEAKGLEFDDVVIAFDFKRKAWKIENAEALSLRLLRELYVAVTRAKRRVIILVKRDSDLMNHFLHVLCKIIFSDNTILLTEFDNKTSAEDWLMRGQKLFDIEEYLFASKCFQKGKEIGWENWAMGRHLARMASNTKAAQSLRKALQSFFELGDYSKGKKKPFVCFSDAPYFQISKALFSYCLICFSS